jgi:ParB family chromosome partitioning protein
MSGAAGGQKRPRDLRAGLASLYAGAAAPAAEPVAKPPPPEAPGIGTLGGAPAVFVEQQKQSIVKENAELRAELEQLRTDGGADVLLDPAQVRDRFPPDRTRHAFEDEAFHALRRSIAEHGQDQPILVRPHATEPGLYEIAYGRRRREACRELGVRVKARVKPLTDDELLRAMVRENEEREALSLYERAAFVRRLGEAEGLSVRKLAAMLGISPGYVSRLTRLPVLPPALEGLIGDPRPLSVRTLEDLAAALAVEGALDRILERWGGITPGATPERRARQAIALAAPDAPAPQREQVRVLRAGDGRPVGRLRRRGDGRCVIELAAELAEAEIEAVTCAVEGALAGGRGRGV